MLKLDDHIIIIELKTCALPDSLKHKPKYTRLIKRKYAICPLISAKIIDKVSDYHKTWSVNYITLWKLT